MPRKPLSNRYPHPLRARVERTRRQHATRRASNLVAFVIFAMFIGLGVYLSLTLLPA
jgi:hypothetical protein